MCLYIVLILLHCVLLGGNLSSIQEPTRTLTHPPETPGASPEETETPVCLLCHRAGLNTFLQSFLCPGVVQLLKTGFIIFFCSGRDRAIQSCHVVQRGLQGGHEGPKLGLSDLPRCGPPHGE